MLRPDAHRFAGHRSGHRRSAGAELVVEGLIASHDEKYGLGQALNGQRTNRRGG